MQVSTRCETRIGIVNHESTFANVHPGVDVGSAAEIPDEVRRLLALLGLDALPRPGVHHDVGSSSRVETVYAVSE